MSERASKLITILAVKTPERRRLHVFDEKAKARLVVVFTPGAEAEIAQKLPASKSLFLDTMNVFGAQEEMKKYKAKWKSKGVDVIDMRDVLAYTLAPIPGLTKEGVIKQFIDKAWRFQTDNFDTMGKKFDLTVEQNIRKLIEIDIENYGLEKALTLNTVLSLIPEIPLANMLFTRDQVAVYAHSLIVANMAKDARKLEPFLAETAYWTILGTTQQAGIQLPGFSVIRIPPGQTFEGGDLLILDKKTVSFGVSPRTTEGAVIAIFKGLAEELHEKGIRVIIAVSTRNLTEKQQMDFMHNDTYVCRVGLIGILLCADEAGNRRIYEVIMTNHGPKTIDTGLNYIEYLKKVLKKDVRAMTTEEQEAFGVNNVIVGNDVIFVPSTMKESTLLMILSLSGIPEKVDMEHITAGYGGPDCTVQVLTRADNKEWKLLQAQQFS